MKGHPCPWCVSVVRTFVRTFVQNSCPGKRLETCGNWKLSHQQQDKIDSFQPPPSCLLGEIAAWKGNTLESIGNLSKLDRNRVQNLVQPTSRQLSKSGQNFGHVKHTVIIIITVCFTCPIFLSEIGHDFCPFQDTESTWKLETVPQRGSTKSLRAAGSHTLNHEIA